jgi:hypothetical protein
MNSPVMKYIMVVVLAQASFRNLQMGRVRSRRMIGFVPSFGDHVIH